jgi:hypothetical protein
MRQSGFAPDCVAPKSILSWMSMVSCGLERDVRFCAMTGLQRDKALMNGVLALRDTAPVETMCDGDGSYLAKTHVPQSGHGVPGYVELCASLAVRHDKVDGAEDAGGLGLNFVEILHLEAVSVFCDEGLVVVRRERGPGIDSSVVGANLDVVLARFEEF